MSLVSALPTSCNVTPRQLERWRQKGLIPEAELERLGAPGTISSYPDWVVEQVVELVGILKKDRRLDHALLRLFMRDRWVDEEHLKARYLSFYGKIVTAAGLDSADSVAEDGEVGDALDAAETVVERAGPTWLSRDGLARTLRFRLRKLATETTVDVLVKGVVTQFLTGFFGGRLWIDEDAVVELRAAAGVTGAETDDVLGHGPLLPHLSDEDVTEMCSAYRLTEVLAAVRESSLADLRVARDEWVHKVRLLANFETYAACMHGRRDLAGLGLLQKVARDEIMLALFVPCGIVLHNKLEGWNVELDEVWDPTTAKGREYGQLYALAAQLIRSSDRTGKTLFRNGDRAGAIARAPEEVRKAFYEWGERRNERTVLV